MPGARVTHVYRIRYGGVCEMVVEVENGSISKLISASADSNLLGKSIRADELPTPRYIEAKLLARYGEP